LYLLYLLYRILLTRHPSCEEHGEVRKETERRHNKNKYSYRLTAKLALAGSSEEDLETLSREQLLEKWAEIVLAGKDVPVASKSTYSLEVERERLLFEKTKFAAEIEDRRLARESEEKRLALKAEEKRLAREDEKARFAAEAEERRLAREAEQIRLAREAEVLVWERMRVDEEREERKQQREAEALRAEKQLLELQEANSLQREAIRKEKGKSESVISKLKQYGDAIRNSMTKMSDNPTEIIVFFYSVEHLFQNLEVPRPLYVTLLKPYLNERALMLVNRLIGHDASNYDCVKKYLMDQFRLCPQFFWNRSIVFNALEMKPTKHLLQG